MRLSNKVVLASTNRGKFTEFRALFRGQSDIDLIEPRDLIRNPENLGKAEIHATYLKNAMAKARLANQACHYPSVADDTGLEVSALGGKPGVHSHRYAALTPGLNSALDQDDANRKKLLEELRGKTDRSAKFITTLALLIEGILIHSTGTLEGTITEAPRGENGFGYDSLFVPTGSQKTLAEMTEAEKNSFSHRARALSDLLVQVRARGIVFAKP